MGGPFRSQRCSTPRTILSVVVPLRADLCACGAVAARPVLWPAAWPARPSASTSGVLAPPGSRAVCAHRPMAGRLAAPWRPPDRTGFDPIGRWCHDRPPGAFGGRQGADPACRDNPGGVPALRRAGCCSRSLCIRSRPGPPTWRRVGSPCVPSGTRPGSCGTSTRRQLHPRSLDSSTRGSRRQAVCYFRIGRWQRRTDAAPPCRRPSL